VAQVVGQANSLDQVLIRSEGTRDGAADLCHLQGMGQPGAEIISFEGYKDLRLIFQAAEGGGVDNPVAVALKRCTVIRLVIQKGAPLRVSASYAVWRECPVFQFFESLTVVIQVWPFHDSLR
jgi:hypothetical protein